ncbi:hypothetical protein ACQEVB_22855 [Pseudonocardia sp. CA-107938]|uniref:hypothetical protein n=1 Tax=Pseudonocardia sp. CA-107938 TaxID=3240021 RepID=UPI003D9005DF
MGTDQSPGAVGEEQISSRAEPPLPEEAAAEEGGEDRRASAAEVLRDSEARVAAATRAGAPADAADERRTSAETAPPEG